MAAGKKYVVVGAVAVIPTRDGSERYMYRGTIVSVGAFTEEGIKHVLDVGLIAEAPDPVDEEALSAAIAAAQSSSDDEKPAESWNHERLDAWAAKQNPVVVFTGENPTKAQKLEQVAALAQK